MSTALPAIEDGLRASAPVLEAKAVTCAVMELWKKNTKHDEARHGTVEKRPKSSRSKKQRCFPSKLCCFDTVLTQFHGFGTQCQMSTTSMQPKDTKWSCVIICKIILIIAFAAQWQRSVTSQEHQENFTWSAAEHSSEQLWRHEVGLRTAPGSENWLEPKST